jgi:DNA-binding IclR family transcriptional regulator
MATIASVKAPRIQSLARASAIIDVVAAGPESGVGLSEISKTTGLNKTTAFNLLGSLVVLRLIEQDANTRCYRLGLKLLELGRLVQERLHISHIARPILVDLCRKTNETVNLGLPDLLDLLVTESFQGNRILHARANAGWRCHYHSTALGKAFMAAWDEPMRQAIYNSCGLTEETSNTITAVDDLEAQLARFRQQGYSVDIEENESGVNGIARWIVDGMGEVAAAVSVSGHANRLTEEVMERIAPDIINAADAIADALGGSKKVDDHSA